MFLAESPRIGGVALILAVVLAAGILLLPSVDLIPYYWLAVAAGIGFVCYAFLGDLLLAVLFWFFAVVCLHEEFWRLIVPFFFNLTIPRILVGVLLVLFIVMVASGRIRFVWPGATGWMMVLILGYFTASAVITGFQTIAVATVHYRLIGGYWFPFLVFLFVLHGVRREVDLKRILVFFFLLSVYLTFTGWCEHFKLWSLVFPKFIGDPTKGIHWTRVRGPFLVSAAMGLAMVYAFFNNLLLARYWTAVPRWAIYLVNLAMLPTIFWTLTRSVWLSMIVCGIVWTIYASRRASRVIGVSLLTAAGILVVSVNWENLLTQEREVGGVAQVAPIIERIGLALLTFDIISDYPVTGVGFGHFRDAAPQYAKDPASPYYTFAAQSMEHNNLLSILAECGVIGLTFYALLFFTLLRTSIQLFRILPPGAPGLVSRDLLVLYWILCAAYFIDGMFRETSVNPFANSLFFGLSGMILALQVILSPKPLPQAAASLARTITPAAIRSNATA